MVQLRRLDMFGFKSFADRTQLEFGPGVTAVVGPNGSGKSNVADAVRWVLGEQNARLLRARKMEDIVFGGSMSRRSLGVGEVTLVLDNSDHSLPLEFTEVSLTRRLYRSGDGEYLINGQPCLLRDIIDLFLDSGIGPKCLTVVDQHRLDQILSPDGDERRVLLEDVAGVGKYRSRKRSAVKKLDETREKISRLQDITSELEPRLGPLAEQARRATAYAELRSEHKRLEGLIVTVSLNRLKMEQARERERMERLTAQVDETNLRLGEIESEQVECAEKLETAEREAARLRGESDELAERWRAHRERAVAAEASATQLTTAYDRLVAEVSALEAELEEEVAASDDDAADDGSQVTVEARAAEIRKRRPTAVADADRLRGKVAQLSGEESRARSRLAVLASRRDAAVRRLSRLDQDLKSVKGRQEALAEKRAELGREQATVTDRLNSDATGLDRINSEVERVSTELNGWLAAVSRLSSELAAADAERRAWVEALGDSGDGPDGDSTLSAWLEVPEQWVLAADAALGGVAEGALVRTFDDCVRVLSDMATHGRRTTAWAVREVSDRTPDRSLIPEAAGTLAELVDYSDPEAERMLAPVLAQFIVCLDFDAAVRTWRRLGGLWSVVAADGTVLGPAGGVTGGAPPAARHTRRFRLRRIESGIERLKADLGDASERVSGLRGTLAELQSGQKQAAVRLDGLKSRCAALSASMDLSERDEAQAAADERRLMAERVEVAAEIAAVDDESKRLTAELELTGDALAAHRAELAARQRVVSELDEELKRIDAAIADLRVAAAAKRERERAERARRDEAARRLESAKNRLAEAGNELTARRADSLRERKREAELESALAGLRGELAERMAEAAALRERTTALTGGVAEHRRRLSGLEGWLRRAEADLARTDAGVEQLLARQAEFGEMIVDDDDETDIDRLTERLREVDSRIAELGTINPLAVEEYGEVEARFRFLAAQRDDLRDGAQTLDRAIHRLDSEMKGLFVDALRRVAGEYREVFREMFGGGTAVLDIGDGDDPLTAPVELSVQLPGKRMTSLSLLSGGERALCAITFLFALLRVRTSPFCVLDEIDAALDEANTSRFASFLRRYSSSTQFITITHQKQTMEIARAIYGVTMAEQGVSRVLSLRLEDI